MKFLALMQSLPFFLYNVNRGKQLVAYTYQHRLHKRQGGQSAVEFALVLPILLILLIGILEVGHLVFVYVSVFNASREAARYGAATGINGGNYQYKDCTAIKNAALRLRFLANFTASDITIHYDRGPSTSLSPICENMTPADWSTVSMGSRVVVTINAHFTMYMPFLPIPAFPITSTSARTLIGTVYLPAN